jgi:hypothetical protein
MNVGLFDRGGLTLHDVLLRTTGYKIGSWFYIRDELTLFSEKEGPRPLVLISDYSGGPSAFAFARSSSRPSIFEHAAPPSGHDPCCKVDCRGWIALLRISLDADWLRGTYTCFEPYPAALEAIRQFRERT